MRYLIVSCRGTNLNARRVAISPPSGAFTVCAGTCWHMSSSCTICTDELDGPCSVTACGHIFHTKCLLAWFEHQPVCPLCKTKPNGRPSDFVRELRAPERVELPHGDFMELAAAQEPPSPQAEAKVRAAISHASQEEGAALAAKAEVEGRTKLKRTRVNGLQAAY